MNDYERFKDELLYGLYTIVATKALQYDADNYRFYFHKYSQIAIDKMCDIVRERLDDFVLSPPDNKKEKE